MKSICAAFGRTRQGYYKHLKADQGRLERDVQVLKKVKQIRQRQPAVGGRKLHKMIDPEIKVGRDYMFDLLAMHKLLIKTKKRFVRTSISGKERVKYPNLLKKTEINTPDQAWVVDITYINTCNGFAYLYLLSDLYSRKILGHYLSDNLYAESACKLLKTVLSKIPQPEGTIHHSDHGIQYLSKKYQKILKRKGILCSLTGAARCFDNAVAERINGILKQEFGLGQVMPNLKVARELSMEAVEIYNNERLHTSLGYNTPASVYYWGNKYPPTTKGHSNYGGDGKAEEKSDELTNMSKTTQEDEHVA